LYQKLNSVAALLGNIKEVLALGAKETMSYSNSLRLWSSALLAVQTKYHAMQKVKPLKAFLFMRSFKVDSSNNP